LLNQSLEEISDMTLSEILATLKGMKNNKSPNEEKALLSRLSKKKEPQSL